MGLTTTVAVVGAPWQPSAVGVIVNVTVTGAVVVLVSEPLMLPLPLAAIPVAVVVLSRVQLYEVPVNELVKLMAVMAPPEQTFCVEGVAVATGLGLTVTVKLRDDFPFLSSVLSTVMVAEPL